MGDNPQKKNNYIINHSWNVLRSIWETKDYIPAYLEEIEKEMLPVFEFAAEPEKIDFDDDIALLISTSIKLSKKLSDTQKTIFKWFEPIHNKYKGVFGNLLVWLNMYIVYNDGWFSENSDAVQSLYNMSKTAMFYSKEKNFNVCTNWDGAILTQLWLQYFKSPTFDDYFAEILTATTDRIKTQVTSQILKLVMLGNYLSAFIYSAEATFKYLEQENLLEPVFVELFTNDGKMFHEYQRKLYLVGMGQLLFSEYIPDYISQNIVKIISKMILMLGRLNLAEKYKEQKKDKDMHKGWAHGPADAWHGLEFDEEEDDEKIEDELKEINDYYDGKGLNGNEDGPFKVIKDQENFEKMEEKKGDDGLDDSCSQESSYVYGEASENDFKWDIEMEYDMLVTKVKDVDENQYFKNVILKIYNKNPEEMQGLIKQLSEKQQSFMEKLLQTQTITIESEGELKTVHRRIIKAKRRK
jgi:hypothetical protein